MENQDNKKFFKLEIILSVLTGVNLTDDFNEVIDFYKFVFMDELISTMSMPILKRSICNHILELYPELSKVKCDTKKINKWLDKQKEKYGDEILICIVGQTLEDEKVKKLIYKG